jgi:two-component system, chemotaxis family, CheB/CheR fusion protein
LGFVVLSQRRGFGLTRNSNRGSALSGPERKDLSPGDARTAWGKDHFVQQALLAAIVESSEDAIVSKTLEGRILSWNSAASRIFGYLAEDIIGQSIMTIIPPELHDEERMILEKIRRGERVQHFDTIRVTKDGRRIPISLTISPIRDARGRIVGASKVGRDISERKRNEARLREREQDLLEADRHKDEFVAQIAHEMRNFVAPIQYALALINSPGSSPEQQLQARDIIQRQLGAMRRLLDDLLDASRITSGKFELKTSATDLSSVIKNAVETAQPHIREKQQALFLDIPEDPVTLEADPVRLAQVLGNLLINSSKYTDAGGRILLSARLQDADIVLSVADNGIGMSPDVLPRVFGMFSQASNALNRAEGGLGIGLALVRAIVALHGGTVEACSDGPGCGSEFIVKLPLSLLRSDKPLDLSATCEADSERAGSRRRSGQ